MNVVFHRFDPENMDAEEIARIKGGEIARGEDAIRNLGVDLSMTEREIVERYDGPRVFAEPISDRSSDDGSTEGDNGKRGDETGDSAGESERDETRIERSNADRTMFSRVANSWVPYRGPLGGRGWVNTPSGYVTYQDENPGEDFNGDVSSEYERMATDAVLASDGATVRKLCERVFDMSGELALDTDATAYEAAQAALTKTQDEGGHDDVLKLLACLRVVGYTDEPDSRVRKSVEFDRDEELRSDARLYLMDEYEAPDDAELKRDPLGNPYVEVPGESDREISKSSSVVESKDGGSPALEIKELYRIWVDSPGNVPEDKQPRFADEKCYYEVGLGESFVVDISKRRIDTESPTVRSEQTTITKADLRRAGVSDPGRYESGNPTEIHKTSDHPLALLYELNTVSDEGLRSKSVVAELEERGITKFERVVKARETVACESEIRHDMVKSEDNFLLLNS